MTKLKSKFGRIYKKWNTAADGTRSEHSTWTVRYKGKDYATGESDPKRAEKFLLALAGDIAHGTHPGAIARTPAPADKPVLMSEIMDGFDFSVTRRGNATGLENISRAKLHVRPFFDALPAATLTSATIEEYVGIRLDQEAARSTINKELSWLKRALNIAVKRDPPLIARRPHIEMLKGLKIRKGFLGHPEYARLKDCLPDYLRPVLVAGYHVGNRRGELLQIEIRDVEMDAIPQPQLRLYPDATKNGEGRVIPIYGEMIEVFRAQIAMTRKKFPKCPWLFHHDGEQILTFYKAWNTAIALAGIDGLLFHDLRRTAVRNLVRSGVSRTVAMEITGHLTESTFERYNISSEEDLRDAASKMETYLRRMESQLPPAPRVLIS